MVDANFFHNIGPLDIHKLLDLLKEKGIEDITYWGTHDASVNGVATLKNATQYELSFFHNKKYAIDLETTTAGFVITKDRFRDHVPKSVNVLATENPYRAYAFAAQILYPHHDAFIEKVDGSSLPQNSIHESVILESNVVIKQNAFVDAGTMVGANTVIGRGVRIGKNCRIGQNVTLSHCYIGDNVTILPGTCIGQSGFGFHMDEKGAVTVPQLGRVIIEDHVEIGSNVTIDRGALEDTYIGQGTRIDNLVQLGHGVRLGRGCIIVSQVGISGSTHLGNYVVAAGQAGFAGHLHIGDGAQIGAKAGIMRDIEPGTRMGGYPAVPIRQWHKQTAALAKLVGGGTPGRAPKQTESKQVKQNEIKVG